MNDEKQIFFIGDSDTKFYPLIEPIWSPEHYSTVQLIYFLM